MTTTRETADITYDYNKIFMTTTIGAFIGNVLFSVLYKES